MASGTTMPNGIKYIDPYKDTMAPCECGHARVDHGGLWAGRSFVRGLAFCYLHGCSCEYYYPADNETEGE